LNFKVTGQGHMVFCVFLCAWCGGYPRTVLSLVQGLMVLFFLTYFFLSYSGLGQIHKVNFWELF